MVAGDPGKVTLSYGGELRVDGQLNARPSLAGVKGGTLKVENTSNNELTLSSGLIGNLLTYKGSDNGFDDATFISRNTGLV